MPISVTNVISSLVSVLLVSLVSLAGLTTLSLSEVRLRGMASALISFAVGALLGDAFLHLIPQALARHEARGKPLAGSLLVLSGIMAFFVLEKLLLRRRGAVRAPFGGHSSPARPELVAINLVGDGIHNFIDGILIGTSYLASPTLGISTTLAVLLHEIPQELGDFSILVHCGVSVKKAVLLNLASASTAVLGTLLALFVGSLVGHAVIDALLPVMAGGFIYLAAANLIPELQLDRSARALLVQTSLILLGIVLMGVLTLFE